MALINPLIGSNLVTGAAPFTTTLIEKSVWMDGSADGFTRAASDFDDEDGKEFTLGTWFQLTEFGVTGALFCADAGSNVYTALRHSNDNKIYFQTEAGSAILSTPNLYRDIGWYHLLLSVDTTQGVSSNRVRLFINGEEVTLSGTQPSLNHVYEFNLANKHEVGDSFENGAFEGYLAQSFMIGSKSIQQGDFAITDFLDTFTLGTNGSQFIPKKHSEIKTLVDAGSDNSFLLDYDPADPTASNALGLDISSYGNNFTSTSMGSANQSPNTPSKVYSVFNPLANADQALPATFTLSEGNQKIAIDNSNTSVKMTLPFVMSGSNIIRTQFTFDSVGDIGVGITGSSHTAGTYHTASNSVAGRGEVAFFTNAGALGLVIDGNFNNPAFGGSDGLSNGDIVDVFVNCNVGAVYFAVNGTIKGGASQADIQNGVTTNAAQAGGSFVRRTAGEVFNFYAIQVNPSGGTITANTGQSAFTHSYSSITSLTSLNTANLPAPDYQGIDYFDATIYEGNGKGQRVGDFVPFTDSETVANSTIFNDDDSTHLTKTYVTATAATTFTFACWFKPGSSTGDQYIISTGSTNATEGYIAINHSTGGGQIWIADPNDGSGFGIKTNATFTDPSQWYHLCVGVDSTAGSGSRVKVEVNGVEQTVVTLGGTTEPSSSQSMNLNEANAFNIGRRIRTSGDYFDGYLANVYFIDGEKKQASDFGQLDASTNRWVAKAYTGDFNNNGYKLAFGTASTGNGNTDGVGTDTSGEGHNWAEQGFTTSDQVTDSPSINFAVLDPGTLKVSTGTLPIAEGNLKVGPKSGGGGGAYRTGTGFSIPEGSWIYKTTMPGKDANLIGLWTESGIAALDGGGSTKQTGFYGISMFNGELSHNKTETSASDAASIHGYTWASDISSTQAMNVLINRTGSVYKLWFVKDGATAAAGNPAAGTGAHIEFSSTEAVYAGIMVTAASHSLTFDFGASNSGSFTGNSNFSDYKLINQDNLDNTASKLTAWAWIKNRDATDNHILVDRVRGVGKDLHSNSDPSSGLAPAEATNMNTVQRFLQRGVQIGNDVEVNTANESYVLWQWLLGNTATTATSFSVDSISSGVPNLASTALVADADHFAIVSYTGAGGSVSSSNTIRHGMSGAPEMIWVKERDNANGWIVSSTGIGFNKVVRLDTGDIEGVDDGAFKSTAPTSTLITLGSNNGTNRSSGQMICYAFRSVPGVCKIGTYFGNGDGTGSDTVDGPYVNCGFRPRWILFKWLTGGSLSGEGWVLKDTARQTINPNDDADLIPSGSNAEAAGATHGADILSDGFKIRGGGGAVNKSGAKYLYMAIADIGGNGTLPPIYGR